MTGKKRILYLCFIFLMAVCGCGRKEVDYEDITATATDESGGEATVNAKQVFHFSEQLGVPERWEDTVLTYDGRTATVSADVWVPDISGAKSIQASLIKLTPEYKQAYLEKLSEGEIYLYDEAHMPKSHLQKIIDYFTEFVEEMSEQEGVAYDDGGVLDYWKTLYENAPEELVVAEDCSCNDYLITYKGILYELKFEEDEEGYISRISMFPFDAGEVLKEPIESDTYDGVYICRNYCAGYSDFNINTYKEEENACSLDYENICAEADSFLNMLGIDDFGIIYGYDLEILYERESWNDGCGLVLMRNIDGMYLAGAEKVLDETPHMYEHGDTILELYGSRQTQEIIDLYVNDRGTVGFQYSYPLDIGNTVSENVSLLAFDKICDCFEKQISESRLQTYRYEGLSLVYYICSESSASEECMIVPAWRLTGRRNEYADEQSEPILINAIDGSLIRQ